MVLDLSQTFYVRVMGERVADLVPISTGTLLKVTPRLIRDGDKRLVQLIVDIEDGSVQDKLQVDSLPTVRQSNISRTPRIAMITLVSCARVNGPRNLSSLARRISTRNRSTPAKTR